MVTIPTPRTVQEGCVTHGARGCGNHRVSGELLGCGHQVQRQKGGCWGGGGGGGPGGGWLGRFTGDRVSFWQDGWISGDGW